MQNELNPVCNIHHDKSHHIINNDSKNYICYKYKEYYVKYCKNCKMDLAFVVLKRIMDMILLIMKKN